ncbi:sterile alpha motif domain-containing protein 14 isoform X1 [Leucoraja erinacea]|uniref:sterile alpha motif domain-containing protein 14 isoform X1 n=2 Tax=Leucoraja erinaceus TaxID=7782 RepID=UPI0024582A62|nr:sterile alpha motif domain-containing protein 14 isoform X1 [Leucoraja erinacea]
MSRKKPGDADEVFDFNEAIPETERLDSSLQKARAQLSVKARRQRPSRSRLRDSISSTEGDDSLERKVSDSYGSPLHNMRSPLHSSLRGSSPSSESVISSASPSQRAASFSFDVNIVRRTFEEEEQASMAKARFQTLTNASSQEALGLTPTSSPSKSCHSSDTSPVHTRRERRAEKYSEGAVTLFCNSFSTGSEGSKETSPAEPASPTVGLDRKARRKFLDLGVQLRRSSSTKGRKAEKAANRLSTGSRESFDSPISILASAKAAVPQFVPFSWFTDSSKGSTSSSGTMSPTCSPRMSSHGLSPKKSASQESTLSDDNSPKSGSPRILSSSTTTSRATLSLSSDEFLDEGQPYCLVSTWTTQQVCQWLLGLNMEHYVSEFTVGNIDGEQLLHLDGGKLKALGVINSQDRATIKRKIKDMNTEVEKERKASEKLEKQKEKQKKKEQEQLQKKS